MQRPPFSALVPRPVRSQTGKVRIAQRIRPRRSSRSAGFFLFSRAAVGAVCLRAYAVSVIGVAGAFLPSVFSRARALCRDLQRASACRNAECVSGNAPTNYDLWSIPLVDESFAQRRGTFVPLSILALIKQALHLSTCLFALVNLVQANGFGKGKTSRHAPGEQTLFPEVSRELSAPRRDVRPSASAQSSFVRRTHMRCRIGQPSVWSRRKTSAANSRPLILPSRRSPQSLRGKMVLPFWVIRGV